MPSVEDQADTLELINTELAGRLMRQGAASSQVDTKAALLAGVAATGAQFLASQKDPSPGLGYATAALIFYAITFLAAVGAYAVVRFTDVPEPRELVRECAQLTKGDTFARLVAARVKAFEINRKRHRRKVQLWWVSVCALGLGLALSTVALVQHTA